MSLNAGLLLAARLASAATTVLVLVLIARLRGAEAFGAVAVGFSIGGIAASVSDAGTASLVIREGARRPGELGQLLGVGILVRVLSVPIAMILITLVGLAVAPAYTAVIVLAGAGLVVQQAAELTRAAFVARQRMAIASGHAIIENAMWLVITAWSLASGLSLEQTFLLALPVWIGSFAAGILLVRRMAAGTLHRPSLARVASSFRMAAPMGVVAVLGMAYRSIDPILLTLLLSGPGLAIAGTFFAANRLLQAFDYLPEAVSRALFPRLSQHAVNDEARVVQLLRSTGTWLLLVGGIAPAVLIPAGGLVMALLFGEEIRAGGVILGALAVSVPIRYLGILFGVTLMSGDATGRRLVSNAAALVLVVLLEAVGIPLYGIAGAIVATIAGACIILALNTVFLHERFGSAGIGRGTFAAILIASKAAGAIGLATSSAASSVVAAIAGAGSYAAAVAIVTVARRRSVRAAA